VLEQRRERVANDELHRLELNLHPNEASGLLTVEDEGVHLRLTRPETGADARPCDACYRILSEP
jgi:hypothetical protein